MERKTRWNTNKEWQKGWGGEERGEKKMVNEAIRWADRRASRGEDRKNVQVPFLRPTTASSSVPCGVLDGKKVGRRVMGKKEELWARRTSGENGGYFCFNMFPSLFPIRQSVCQFRTMMV